MPDTFTIHTNPKIRKVIIHYRQDDLVIYTLKRTKTQIHIDTGIRR